MKSHGLIMVCIFAVLFATWAGTVAKPEQQGAEKTVAAGNNEFAWKLYGKIAKNQKGNLFFSPYSISIALGMTYAGAAGDTAKEIRETLCFPEDETTLHSGMAALVNRINEDGKQGKYLLSVANALWGQKNFEFNPDFLEQIRDNYDSGLTVVDFIENAEQARQVINQWIANKTNDKIKDMISQGVLDVDTRLVLTNAIYFKGDWEKQFDEAATRDGDFFVDNSNTVKTPLMSLEETTFRYAENDLCQVIEIPYKDDELSMVAMLPKTKDGLAAVEAALDATTLGKWMGELCPTDVELVLPKFKFEYELSLNDSLAKLGMGGAFTANADFSRMTGEERLYIANALHKAFIEVNETGTEAAAATVIECKQNCKKEIPRFVADHPFVFMIRHNDTGSILFAGRVANPTE